MPRDTTVRQRVIDYLTGRGPVEDRSGRATSRLKEAVGYQGGDAGFIRIVSLMAESGEILRDVRGKRTYRIAVSEEAAARASSLRSSPTTAPAEQAPAIVTLGRTLSDGSLDYDQLAAALLARVARTISETDVDSRGNGDGAGWARRRIDQLETKLATLQRDLARARAEVQAVTQERDELQSLYDAATHNIEVFAEQKGTRPAAPAARLADGLDSEEQALLYRLRRPNGQRGPRGTRPASPTSIG